MSEPEPLKWSVTSSSESRLMPIVGLIQDSSGYEVGLLANQGKILPPILWGIHDNLVFTSGCDKLGEDDYYTSPNELSCLGPVWSQVRADNWHHKNSQEYCPGVRVSPQSQQLTCDTSRPGNILVIGGLALVYCKSFTLTSDKVILMPCKRTLFSY